jgi:membrane protease YdiL (CAAX protease family)
MTATMTSLGTSQSKLIAPWWHTTLLIALFLVMAAGGARFQHQDRSASGTPGQHVVLPLYVSLILMEWGLVYYVWKAGLRRSGITLRQLVGGRWESWKDAASDILLGLLLWVAWRGLQFAWIQLVGAGHAASIDSFLPRRPAEIVAWALLCISAGICEELVFRGYFQKQFQALTSSTWAAVIFQAVLFGIAHGYQGAMACATITIYGVLFGSFALWRNSLRPGMIAHAWTDLAAGLFGV